jgi:hypothetical protein
MNYSLCKINFSENRAVTPLSYNPSYKPMLLPGISDECSNEQK